MHAGTHGSDSHVAAMPSAHSTRVRYWLDVLRSGCFDGREDRLVVVAQLLVGNGFSHLAQLREAEHPREWVGAEDLEERELNFSEPCGA